MKSFIKNLFTKNRYLKIRFGKEHNGTPPFFLKENNDKQNVVDFSNDYEELWNYGSKLWHEAGKSTFITDFDDNIQMIFD